MKKGLFLLCIATLALPATLLAEVTVNVGIGIPLPAPPPLARVVIQRPPAVLFSAPPLFIAPPKLGLYVGVDVPYDIVFEADNFYLHYGDAWYRSGHYNGPWVVVQHERLPSAIRRHRTEVIRSYRDDEYRVYHREREHYRGRHFRPEKEWRKQVKEDRKQEKRDWKEERKREKRELKEERKQERGHSKHRRDDD